MRIGLIAISRLRVCDTEKLRTGYLNLLTKIYDEEFVAQRYRNFHSHLRKTGSGKALGKT